jgi:hypothetical protein
MIELMATIANLPVRKAVGAVAIAAVLVAISSSGSVATASDSALLVAQGNIGPGQPPIGPPAPQPPKFAPRPFGPMSGNRAPEPGAPAAGGPEAAGKGRGGIGGALGGAITGAILGALIGLVLWALRRTAKAPINVDPRTGGAVVAFSRGLQLLVLGFSLFTPAALLIAAFFMPAQNSAAYVVLGVAILLFAALGTAVSWSLLKSRIIATADGLVVESGWKRGRRLPWTEIVEVVHDKRSGGLLFRGLNKKSSVLISPLMAGLKPFVAVMQHHLPADCYAKTADLLARIDRLEGGNAMPFMGRGG